jgi:preprotein translocase subunit SecA
MLKKILNTFFGSRNDRLLDEYSKKVSLINELELKVKKLKDSEFKFKTKEFQSRVRGGENLEFNC